MKETQSEAFYKKLQEQIDDTTPVWPSQFLYKFILPTDTAKITELENHFNHMGAVINKKTSKNKKYTSISILVQMKNSNDIIAKYKEVSKIEGIISL